MGVREALVVAERVPQVLPLQPAPESVQRTPRFRLSLRTVAVNCWEPPPAWTLAVVGETVTEMRYCAVALGTNARPTRGLTANAARIDCQDARWNFTRMRELLTCSKGVDPRHLVVNR